jgi:hypothetical protein
MHLLLMDSAPCIGDFDPDDDPFQRFERFGVVVACAQSVFRELVDPGRESRRGPFVRYPTGHPSNFCRIGVE